MDTQNVIKAASVAFSIALTPFAFAADAPSASKAPGTIAAPSPPDLSYLKTVPPSLSTAPKAQQPVTPLASSAPKAVPAITAPVQVTAPTETAKQAANASIEPEKKPVAKATQRAVKKVAPVKTAATTFDFPFKGDLWTAMQVLASKQPQLVISREGTPVAIPVRLDMRDATLLEVLAALGEQGGTEADLIYHRDTQTARIKYRNAVPRPVQQAAIPVPPPVSPIEEARNWQQGGTARPVMGQDGLLMFPFGQSQPTLTCQPLRACDIQLQAGEIINNVILGDTVRWIPAPATTGNGTQATPHVIVKPTEVNLQTNLIVTTNRRTYMMTLKSSETDYVSRVSFYYPQEMVQDWNGQAEAERRKAEADASRKISDLPIASIDQLNLDGYVVKGDRSLPWYPVRVFDEGTHVWIQMPATIKSSEAPALVLIGQDGNSELVNYRVKQATQGGSNVTYYIVDKLFSKAALILGVGGDQQKVEIVKASKGSWFNRMGS